MKLSNDVCAANQNNFYKIPKLILFFDRTKGVLKIFEINLGNLQ